MSRPPSRFKPAQRKLRPATLGQDFGSSSSKCALSHQVTTRMSDGLQTNVHVSRVPLRADMDDPERDNTDRSNQNFEFVAAAALRPRDPANPLDEALDALITGRQALAEDNVIWLKTMFVWRAGIQSPEVLFRLPGGSALQEAVRDGRITNIIVDQAVVRHFSLLREMSVHRARALSLVIKTIVISYPNYLCEALEESDPEAKYYCLDLYLKYYLEQMGVVWKADDVTFDVISECQSTALYICEPFVDDNTTLDRDKMWQAVAELLRARDAGDSSSEAGSDDDSDSDLRPTQVRLLVVDNGSSTFAFHPQTTFFNAEGELIGSQSLDQEHWAPGTTGGSHLTNERVKTIMEEDLSRHPAPQPGYLAEVLAQYETAKHGIDYHSRTQPLVFHTSDGQFQTSIPAASIKNIFLSTFSGGLELLDEEIRRMINLGEDFVVIFCGGSYMNRGLRHDAERHIDKFKAEGRKQGVTIGHLFLAHVDNAPRVAVACGNALASMRVPTVDQLLRGSAIGIQVEREAVSGEGGEELLDEDMIQWDREEHADFLFSKGCVTPPHIDYLIEEGRRERLRFRFVCDPNYYDAKTSGPTKTRAKVTKGGNRRSPITGQYPAKGTTRSWAQIPIAQDSHYLNQPGMDTYDLGFKWKAANLPNRDVRFYVTGPTAASLAPADGRLDDLRAVKTQIEVRCVKINKRGAEVDHPKNTKWKISLQGCFGAKLLTTESARAAPIKCPGESCGQELVGTIYICRDCDLFAFCEDCYESNEEVPHIEGHTFDECEW